MTTSAASQRLDRHPPPVMPGPRVTARTRLQQSASRNIVRHWLRNALRVSVLMLADLAVILGIHAAVPRMMPDDGTGFVANGVQLALRDGVLTDGRFIIFLILALLVAGAYGAGDLRKDASRLFIATSLVTAFMLYGKFQVGSPLMVGAEFAATVALVGVSLTTGRLVVDSMVGRYRTGVGGRRVITVSGGEGDWIDPALLAGVNGSRPSLRLVGSVTTRNGDSAPGSIHLDELGSEIEKTGADTVFVCGPLTDLELGRVVDTSLVSGCLLLMASRTARVGGLGAREVWIDGFPAVELTAPSLKAWQLAVKRAIDLVVSSVGLILLVPVFAVISLLVWLDSPGPVFFRQWRVGRAGKPFRMYKFRSMMDGAEAKLAELRTQSIYNDGRLFKVPDDPRVTRVGRWLRRTSLDEFPQLFNVFRGDMSLVGPRPPLHSEVETYEEHHYCRFDVKPGITGPWQVSGRNQVTDFDEVMRLESEYVRNWSLLVDLRILLRTVPVVLRAHGAH